MLQCLDNTRYLGQILSVQFSLLTNWVVGDMRTIQQRSSSSLFGRRPLWAVLAWTGMSTLWFCSSGIFSADAASPTLQGALKDGFGEAVGACDMPEPCKFPSLHSCQKRFLWTHKGVDLAPHPVVGLVFQGGDTGKFPHELG